MKFPTLEGKFATMRVNQKVSRKCYENNAWETYPMETDPSVERMT